MKTLVFRLLLVVALGASVTLTVTARQQPVQQNSMPMSASNTAEPEHTPWSPKIAFQFYETKGIDAPFVAQNVDWLMMRYGAEKVREDVIEAGYGDVIPQYLQFFQIDGPGPYKSKKDRCKNDYTPMQNNVMWTRDFCKQVHPNESWFLHNGDGERLHTKERNWDGTTIYGYYMNPASEGFREFWVEQVRAQEDAGWEAFFLDNVAATYSYLRTRADNEDGEIKEYDSDGEWQSAVVEFLQFIRENFPEREIWGNLIEAPPTADAWDRYRGALDGIQEEGFATNWVGQPVLSVEAWEAMISRAEQTLAEGKSTVLYAQGEQNDFARMRFGLASYLLVATPDNRVTFRYTHTAHYETLWWYPEYEFDLGLPLEPRRQQGAQWVREFACGTVTVDPANQTGTITMQPCRAS